VLTASGEFQQAWVAGVEGWQNVSFKNLKGKAWDALGKVMGHSGL